jgi:hypothetical protein
VVKQNMYRSEKPKIKKIKVIEEKNDDMDLIEFFLP